MTNRIARKTLPFSQILLILVGIVVLYMLVGFGRLIRIYQQQRLELQQTEQRILLTQREQTELQKELEYAQSASAAEEWARKNGMARESEVPVVVIAPPASQPLSPDQNPKGSHLDSPRDAWWDLFGIR